MSGLTITRESEKIQPGNEQREAAPGLTRRAAFGKLLPAGRWEAWATNRGFGAPNANPRAVREPTNGRPNGVAPA
ncbi:hypothetical protein MPNT_10265 [Candidatus Methylacidithermus pantelleriae]|uniref:Uncharacterized protein n=1 Tax=Candidatus Methylacidithermus pantelleriae TaxID=2744239 RepID=A0A8J2BM87_9BACT|nr:hypothetical protein MPNT_10265 [Candidatus Methylacidithermus pantelleriae]